MKILLVDNYDSFTYNLFHLIGEVFGREPVVVPNDCDWSAIAKEQYAAVVISPGPGRPERPRDFGISLRVLDEINAPVLGICLGQQGIYTFFGGTVVRAEFPVHGRLSPVFHAGEGLFRNVPSPFDAVRYHSLSCAAPIPPSIRATAWTNDGTLMAIAHKTRPIWGLQFHPESICTEHGKRFMENFRSEVLTTRGVSVHAVSLPKVGEPQTTKRFVSFKKIKSGLPAAQIFKTLFGGCPYAFWLDSSRPDSTNARFSFMGGYGLADVEFIRYIVPTRTLETGRGGRVTRETEDLFSYLKNQLASRTVSASDLPFEFVSGFIGYFGYELKDLCGSRGSRASSQPDSYLLSVDRFVAIDHATEDIYIVAAAASPEDEAARSWISQVESRIYNSSAINVHPTNASEEILVFSSRQSRLAYKKAIEQCLEAIREGESYEICLTNRLTASTTLDPLEYYLTLRSVNPSPYGAFLRFPELSIACSSPELFLKISEAGDVESKPIKGTSRRGTTPEDDGLLKESLVCDEKSRSENLMIVDLLRNDLGRVCSVGSVRVPSLMNVETYATVHQLVSTITGHLRPEYTAVDCLRAAFPGGSMTGAPKIRTMDIIDELETRARGVYSGSIGFLSANGSADLNIVIRTAVFSAGRVEIGVGGAIVALSDLDAEWEEVMLKAQALLTAFQRVCKGVSVEVD